MHTLQQLKSGELIGAKHLRLSCKLTEFPDEIFTLVDSLEILDLSQNKLSALPDNFGLFSKLKILFMSDNLFTKLPEVLSACKQLEMIGFKSNHIVDVPESSIPATTRWLILTNNKIKQLPASIGNCNRLQKVALVGNELTVLPSEMAMCQNLELLRISANQFTALPQWLLKLPKLSWLAFSGNPFCKKPETYKVLNDLPWNDFEVLDQLGEGASGIIYKALYHQPGITSAVAIKVFKGEVTSDGLPEDEMNASILAGTHSCFPSLLGRIKNHPQQKQGLVMALIPPTYKNLGNPPSLESCSRDTFAPGTFFHAKEILKIVTAIASAVQQLHSRGMMHGDLYAHNILVDQQMNTLFTDFGAASIYQNGDAGTIQLQQIEARAFGCLLDDLVVRVATEDGESPLVKKLILIRDNLFNTDPSLRPLFEEIVGQLNKLNLEI